MSRSRITYVVNPDGTPGESWNPVTGCTPVSDGCRSCWAQAYLGRFNKQSVPTLHPERLADPSRWRKPRTVAVCFLGDLFHPDVPDYFIGRVFATIAKASAHRFIVLTKRASRLEDWSRGVMHHPEGDLSQRPVPGWPTNAWLGVSVEDQATAEKRLPYLLRVPAVNRWISLEPQLGPVDLSPWINSGRPGRTEPTCSVCMNGFDCRTHQRRPDIGWVVQGCESGPRRRPFKFGWAHEVRAACAKAGVPYFLKQLPTAAGVDTAPCLDGERHDAVPWRKR